MKTAIFVLGIVAGALSATALLSLLEWIQDMVAWEIQINSLPEHDHLR